MNIFKLLCFVTAALRMTCMECCEYPKLLLLDFFLYFPSLLYNTTTITLL